MTVVSDFKHKRQYSQNFLTDASILQHIASSIGTESSDFFLEVGPGEGALTERLVPACQGYTALELDPRLIPILSKRFAQHQHFKLIHIDALTYDYESHEPAAYRLIGNLPYHISTPLMQRFLGARQNIKDMHLMFQKEVAERICAPKESRKRGRLTLIAQLFCECEYLFTIDAEAFNPPPKVDSAVIRLIPHQSLALDESLVEDYVSIVTQSFGAKRKTLYNNLRGVITRSALEAIGIDPNSRAEALSVADFITITQTLAP